LNQTTSLLTASTEMVESTRDELMSDLVERETKSKPLLDKEE